MMLGNAIGDEGAKYIGDMLRVNKTLRTLCEILNLRLQLDMLAFRTCLMD
jgi:hypothetical protein